MPGILDIVRGLVTDKIDVSSSESRGALDATVAAGAVVADDGAVWPE